MSRAVEQHGELVLRILESAEGPCNPDVLLATIDVRHLAVQQTQRLLRCLERRKRWGWFVYSALKEWQNVGILPQYCDHALHA